MTVLITGALGFIGINLALRLAREQRVVAVDLAGPDDEALAYLRPVVDSIEFCRADLRDAEWFKTLPSGAYDAAVHAAAITPVAPDQERDGAARAIAVNVLGTARFYEWAAQARPQRIVHISSGAVYGMGPSGVEYLDEELLPAPESVYGITKAAGEALARRLARLHDLHVTVLRLTHTFGPMERPTSSRTAMSPLHGWSRAALRGEPMQVGVPSRRRDYVYVEDVGEVVAQVLGGNAPPDQTLNVSSGIPVTELETVQAIARLVPGAGYELGGEPGAVSSLRPPLEVSRLKTLLPSLTIRDLEAGLHAYLGWLSTRA